MNTNARYADSIATDSDDCRQARAGGPATRVLTGHLHRVPDRLHDDRLGTAIIATCDGKELRVQVSTGDRYRVDIRAHVARWGLAPRDLRMVRISRDGMVLRWPRLGSELSVATIIGTTEERLAPLAGSIKPTRVVGADADIADEYDIRAWRLNPRAPGLKEGSLYRVDRHLPSHSPGVAVSAKCDGYEIRIELSNGDWYRVDIAPAADRWCVSQTLLRRIEIREGGRRLYWPLLDAEVSVATLIGATEEDLARLADGEDQVRTGPTRRAS